MKLKAIFSVLFTVSLWTTNTSMAQTIKTYNGPLEKPASMISSIRSDIINATYQYYEDGDGRVWHGTFYTSNGSPSLSGGSFARAKVSGHYEHGKQTGQWTETWLDNISGKTRGLLKYSFKSGKLNGAYTFQEEGLSINTSFNENKFTGTLTVTTTYGYSIKGQFDEQGLASGEWIEQYKRRGIQYIRKYIYDHGIAMRIVEFDNSTGTKTVLLEATKSDYGTIVIGDQHYKTILNDSGSNLIYDYIPLGNSSESMFDFLENEMPLYHWIEQPFVGLKRTDDPSQTKEEVYHTTEIMPMFPGGDSELLSWIRQNLRPQVDDNGNRITGRVICQFIIEKDGSVSNIQVLKSPDSVLADEAVRVLKSSPKWEPGKHNGQAVRIYYRIPISFKEQ